MQPILSFQDLEKTLSVERLRPYRTAPEDTDSVVLARYLWNMALSHALYPALHLLEVSLRNRIHQAATERFGTIWLKDSRSF